MKTATPTSRDQENDLILSNDILNISSGLSQPPIIMVSQSSYNHSQNDPKVKSRDIMAQDEQYQLYSTPFIVTIVIGCTLLALNIFVFMAVYYRDRSSRRRYHQNCSRKKRHHEHCDSSCSVSNTSSLKGTPDVCSKLEKPLVENGDITSTFSIGTIFFIFLLGIYNNFSSIYNYICMIDLGGVSNTQQSDTKTLPSILKKSQQIPSSSQSSVLILQPSHHLSSETSIELSNFTFSASKSSTLPKPLPPPRDPRTSSTATSTSSFSPSYVNSGTLNRYTNSHLKDLEDLRV